MCGAFFYMHVHVWFAAMHVFAFAHVCDTRVPFKLWVICTVSVNIVNQYGDKQNSFAEVAAFCHMACRYFDRFLLQEVDSN